VFGAPTIAGLAVAIGQANAPDAFSVVPVNPITPETTVITPEMLPLLS
jgi:hypothetical protein